MGRKPAALRHVRPALLLVTALLLIPGASTRSRQVNPRLLETSWTAQWVACLKAPPHEFGVCYFRKTITLAEAPAHFVVHVSADNRYELYVNGARVSRGPARGDLDHWRFETLDLAPHLRPGTNVLAALVWNFADAAPVAQMSYRTGFVLQGDSDLERAADTGPSWKALLDSSRTTVTLSEDQAGGYFAAGPGERLDASRVPWGWQAAGYDDSAWPAAASLGAAGPRGMQDTRSRWMLVQDPLPPQEESAQRLARVVRTQGVTVSPEFVAGRAPFTVPAHAQVSVLFDQSFETTAYPELVVSGGKGARVRVTYAEALKGPDGRKGNRNETDGKKIGGLFDEFLPDGGEHRRFEPLWWRAYRYLQMDIAAGAEPLTVEDLRASFTAYPFREQATFESDDPILQRIWETGWRTARLCAHETYMDCPYYEQLQYVGDTRIQALISLYLAGDDRLVKNAIELLADSQTPEGLTQSRYPSSLPQYIPPFSLYWIGMMHDLWWYRGESAFLKPLLPNMREALAWYERRQTRSGLLGRLPWWPFVDWADEFRDGEPPQEADGQSSVLSLQYAGALAEAADLESALGDAELARRDRALAASIASAVFRSCWDPKRRLLADTPARRHFSQQANILGVLAGAIPAADRKGVVEQVLRDGTLTPSSYYFRFYLFRAMKQVGLADEYLPQLAPWREMLDQGLTTFAETPGNPRSDCHAWSAHPDFDLLATVAGIEPAAPGFAQVRIEPHLGPRQRVSASVPHPRGAIAVRYERHGNGLAADVTLPPGLSGWFVWKGRREPLHPGGQHLKF